MNSLSEIRKTVTTWYDARRDILDDTIGTDHPGVVATILTGAGLVAAGLLAGLFWLFATVIESTTVLLDHLAADVHDTPAIQNAVRLITEPIRNYLATHAAGTGLSASLLGDSWLAVGGILILFALLESRGARIGWALYGAASVAMVWFGTDWIAHRPIAAGITGLTWTLISIGTLHRIGQRPPTVVVRNVAPRVNGNSAAPTRDSETKTTAAFPMGISR